MLERSDPVAVTSAADRQLSAADMRDLDQLRRRKKLAEKSRRHLNVKETTHQEMTRGREVSRLQDVAHHRREIRMCAEIALRHLQSAIGHVHATEISAA